VIARYIYIFSPARYAAAATADLPFPRLMILMLK
jgi:hypothetical protein